MVGVSALLQIVDDVYRRDAGHLPVWADPHRHRSPDDDEYSRVLDPAKWRIVTARADAWAAALEQADVAALDRDTTARWAVPRGPATRLDRLTSPRPGTLPLILAHQGFEGRDDNGLTIGAGNPTIELEVVPHCGCDACDSGSHEALDGVDDAVLSVVAGTFRHLTDGDRRIDVRRDSWRASGSFGNDEIDSILASPRGWHEVGGASWID